jgi:hypothetical protein
MGRWTGAWALGMVACDPGNPCDAYVDYMCDCHPEVSCDDLFTTYAEPDPSVQDECAILLDQQEEEDAAAGLECPVTTPTGMR